MLSTMNSDDYWKRAVDVAQIVSAVATFATVVVATRLWAKQFKPRLKVSLFEARIVDPAGSRNYVSISLINTGLTPVIVSGLQYRPSPRFDGAWFQIPDYTNPLSAQIPLKLSPGETGQFLFSPDEWFTQVTRQLSRTYDEAIWVRLLWKRYFRVEVLATTGQAFAARPSRAMIKRLDREFWKIYLESKQSTADAER